MKTGEHCLCAHRDLGVVADYKREKGLFGYIVLYVHPLLGNGLVNKFPRRQIFGKQSVARSRNNKTNVYSSLLGNNQSANGLAR
jgi:hypothetical protein